MVLKWPWMKDLYNSFSRDKAAFQEKMSELSAQDKQLFKSFCLKVSRLKLCNAQWSALFAYETWVNL